MEAPCVILHLWKVFSDLLWLASLHLAKIFAKLIQAGALNTGLLHTVAEWSPLRYPVLVCLFEGGQTSGFVSLPVVTNVNANILYEPLGLNRLSVLRRVVRSQIVGSSVTQCCGPGLSNHFPKWSHHLIPHQPHIKLLILQHWCQHTFSFFFYFVIMGMEFSIS